MSLSVNARHLRARVLLALCPTCDPAAEYYAAQVAEKDAAARLARETSCAAPTIARGRDVSRLVGGSR